MTRHWLKPAIDSLFFSAILLAVICPVAWAKGLESSTAYSVGSQLSAVVVADFNTDGNPDVLVVDSPGGAVISTIHVLMGRGDGTFQPAVHSAATPNLSAVAIGDFDGDNRQDIAVTDSDSNVVTILLGNGDGTFTFKATLSTGSTPMAIRTADVDENGELDLVVANSDDMTLSIFTGIGDGTFASTPVMSAGTTGGPVGLSGLVIGDFDSDQNLDIAVALWGNAMSILKGNGSATFGVANTIGIPFPFTNPTAIAAVDFDQDGALDLIIPTTGKVLFFAGKNNLTFQTPVPFVAQAWPKAIAVGDVNTDGRPDLLVANWFSYSASVLVNNGLGGISATASYSAVTLPIGAAVGDFNNDGKLDLATCGTPVAPFIGLNNVVVLLGNGDGTMRVAFNYEYQTGGALGSNQGVLVADLNNDGRLDIIAGDSSTTATNPKNRISSLNLSESFGLATIQSARQVQVGVPWRMATGKMTASGNLDIIAVGYSAIEVLPGLGNGTFGNPVVTPIDPRDQRKLSVGDFDRDGNLDVVYTRAALDNESRVLFGNGDGTFRPVPTSLLVNSLVNALTVEDFDRDGKLDVGIGSVAGGAGNGDIDIFLGIGDTTFVQVGATLKVGVYPGAMAAEDLNNDGNFDLAVANTGNGNPGSISVLVGNGDGTFQPAVTTPLGSRVVDVTSGDFDGDGFQDVAVSEGSGTVDLFTNLGDATFGTPTQYFAGSAASSLVAADVNEDGAPDLVAAVGSALNVFPNTGGTLVQLTSSQNPSVFPEQVTFLAMMVPTLSGMPVPTGTSHFSLDGTSAGDILLSGQGSASVSLTPGGAGTHSIQGTYDGDANFFPRSFPELSQLVNKAATSTTLVPLSTSVLVGDPVSFNVSVIPVTSGIPNGNVSLLDGTSILSSPALDAAGTASSNITSLTAGMHNVTASYGGDSNYLPSTSTATNVGVFATPDFFISANSENASLRAGQTATITLSLFRWPAWQPMGPMTFSCVGLPSLSSCSFNPSSLLLNGTSGNTMVTISTTAASFAVPPRSMPLPPGFSYPMALYVSCLAFTLAVLLGTRNQKRVPRLAAACLIVLSVALFSSCGGGGGGSGGGASVTQKPSSPGTPAGTSSVVVSATVPTASGSVAHQVTIALTVTP